MPSGLELLQTWGDVSLTGPWWNPLQLPSQIRFIFKGGMGFFLQKDVPISSFGMLVNPLPAPDLISALRSIELSLPAGPGGVLQSLSDATYGSLAHILPASPCSCMPRMVLAAGTCASSAPPCMVQAGSAPSSVPLAIRSCCFPGLEKTPSKSNHPLGAVPCSHHSTEPRGLTLPRRTCLSLTMLYPCPQA